MALTSLISKSRLAAITNDEATELLEFDASLQENHNASFETTQHPVEQGSDVSDHRRKLPLKLTITGVVSNTPLKLFNFGGGAVDGKLPDTLAWETLLRLGESGELYTIVTSLWTYENMAIQSISVPRNAGLGNVLEFTIELQEVFFAESQEVEAPEELKKKPKGKKPTEEATSAEQAKSLSVLQKGLKFLSGLGS